MKFPFPVFDFCLYKSAIQPCMGNCCHAWTGTPSCYLDLLDKLQKWICRTIGPSLAASLESLVLRRNATSLILISRYYFYRYSPVLTKLVPLPHIVACPLVIMTDNMALFSLFPDIIRMSIPTFSVFFLAQLDSRLFEP